MVFTKLHVHSAPYTGKRKVLLSGKLLVDNNFPADDQLPGGKKLQGPAIITEYSATTVVPPECVFYVDRAGNLLIDRATRKR